MSAHTSGPWVVRAYAAPRADNGDIAVIDSNGSLVAVAYARQAQTETNARLIAAAPMLLEALKRCRFDSLNMSLADLDFCRAAIFAATGETP